MKRLGSYWRSVLVVGNQRSCVCSPLWQGRGLAFLAGQRRLLWCITPRDEPCAPHSGDMLLPGEVSLTKLIEAPLSAKVCSIPLTRGSDRTANPHPVSTAKRFWSTECNAAKGSRQPGRATLEDALAPEAKSFSDTRGGVLISDLPNPCGGSSLPWLTSEPREKAGVRVVICADPFATVYPPKVKSTSRNLRVFLRGV